MSSDLKKIENLDTKKSSIIIQKCGPNDRSAVWNSLYFWFVPGLATAAFMILCMILILFIENKVVNIITYIFMLIGSIYIPYTLISNEVLEIKKNCYEFGKENK